MPPNSPDPALAPERPALHVPFGLPAPADLAAPPNLPVSPNLAPPNLTALEPPTVLDPDSPPNPRQLNYNQHRALAALLDAPTVAAAARQIGVNERTIRRWLHDNPDFRDELREMRQQFLTHAATRLQSAASQAVQTLLNLIASEDYIENGRANLIRTALDFAFRSGAYTDLTDRIENLETEVRRQRERGQTPQPRYRSILDELPSEDPAKLLSGEPAAPADQDPTRGTDNPVCAPAQAPNKGNPTPNT